MFPKAELRDPQIADLFLGELAIPRGELAIKLSDRWSGLPVHQSSIYRAQHLESVHGAALLMRVAVAQVYGFTKFLRTLWGPFVWQEL